MGTDAGVGERGVRRQERRLAFSEIVGRPGSRNCSLFLEAWPAREVTMIGFGSN